MLPKVPLRGYLYTAGILNLTTALLIVIFKSFLPPALPILYGRPTGESQLVPVWGLLIPPAVSILIIIMNFILIGLIKDIFLKKILVLATLLVSLLTTIAVLKVVFLVGFF